MSRESPSPLHVVVEKMTNDDVAQAARIGAASFPAGTDGTETSSREVREEAETARLHEELARPWAYVIVAREGARVVAFAVAWLVADEVHVLNVATDPELRRRGAGRALMTHLLDLARSRDVRHMLLEVRRSNAAAIALYRGLGFYAMGVRRAYYADGEDAVEMVLVFDAATREIVRRADEIRLEG